MLSFGANSCPTLWTPWTTAHQAPVSSTVSQNLFQFMRIESVMLSNHFILCPPLLLLLQFFPASESFPMSQFFASGSQSIGASTSASVLPMNIQEWFPLGLTDLISFQSRGLSRIFSSTTIQNHQLFGVSLLYGSTLTSVHNYWKNPSFDYMFFVGKMMSLHFNMLSRVLILSFQGVSVF